MTQSDAPEVEISQNCLAGRLRLLNRAVTGIYDRALRPHGITVAQMSILACVARLDRARPADVAGALVLEKSTLSRNVERMKDRGWLESLEGDDARSQLLRVTSRGRQLMQRVLPKWRVAQDEASRILGRDSARAISKMTDRIRSSS